MVWCRASEHSRTFSWRAACPALCLADETSSKVWCDGRQWSVWEQQGPQSACFSDFLSSLTVSWIFACTDTSHCVCYLFFSKCLLTLIELGKPKVCTQDVFGEEQGSSLQFLESNKGISESSWPQLCSSIFCAFEHIWTQMSTRLSAVQHADGWRTCLKNVSRNKQTEVRSIAAGQMS